MFLTLFLLSFGAAFCSGMAELAEDVIRDAQEEEE